MSPAKTFFKRRLKKQTYVEDKASDEEEFEPA